MDKQERDRLRKLVNLRGVDGAAFCEFQSREVARLLDHIDALEGKTAKGLWHDVQIEDAYREGFSDGLSASAHTTDKKYYSVNEMWNCSNAKAALTQAEEKGGG